MNMVNRLLDAELAPQGIASLALHPGSVYTRMNNDSSDVKPPGEGSMITAEDSVRGMVQRIDELKLSDGCLFKMFDGTVLQW